MKMQYLIKIFNKIIILLIINQISTIILIIINQISTIILIIINQILIIIYLLFLINFKVVYSKI